ncbi:SDR family NAD(P)-dependent oxidoreductase [Mangrovitalea sediminis]|uniref:SDR family NAD(P)-dependent oxidoreductase n=1 Tax=Mangrovitalea sediminis TaxID=1982043 RepID=UPI000BE4B3F0|nr:SDR family NAD(P)-dependent oxidoreductase [Mangrovitalea sediminis]
MITEQEVPATVWLTGASSGIGLALARMFAHEGFRVLATARNQDALNALKREFPARITPLPGDTTSREDVARLAKTLREQGAIELAILNAGTCEYLDVRHFDSELVGRVMETNVMGTVRCVEAVLPVLRQTRSSGLPARLAIMSSSAWWFPFPRAEAYSASKAALTTFALSLRADLAAENIPVTIISPGFVRTPLTDRNDFPMPFRIDADKAARIICRGLQRGHNEIAFPKRFTGLLKLLACLPRPLADRIAANLARNEQQKDSVL